MAEVIKDYAVVSLSENEVTALVELFDSQIELNPRLQDLNNSLQAL